MQGKKQPDLDLPQLERLVCSVLKLGTIASSIIIFTGLSLSLAAGSAFTGFALSPVGLLDAGILFLLAMPLAVIVITTVYFACTRSFTYTGFSLYVLLILLLSLYLGFYRT